MGGEEHVMKPIEYLSVGDILQYMTFKKDLMYFAFFLSETKMSSF